MRRLTSTLLALALVANLCAWPTAALAEALEHQYEPVQVSAPQSAPLEPSAAHCAHGCAGHCGQHFVGQVSLCASPLRACGTEIPAATAGIRFPTNVPALPYRPPLPALIQS